MSRKFRLLAVEDNADDIALIRRGAAAFEESTGDEVEVQSRECVEDMVRELPFCREYDLMLFDLNLRGRFSMPLLIKIRDDYPDHPPICVLSTSSDLADIRKSIRAGANSYLVKPRKVDDFVERVRFTLQFWFHNTSSAQ